MAMDCKEWQILDTRLIGFDRIFTPLHIPKGTNMESRASNYLQFQKLQRGLLGYSSYLV